MVDSMAGVAQDTLRARAEGSEASAFGMHQADAGSDAAAGTCSSSGARKI